MNNVHAKLVIEVQELVRGGDFELALDRVKTASHGISPQLYEEVVLLQSRFARLTREQRKGLLRREDFETELNRLTLSLLSLVGEIGKALPTQLDQATSTVGSESVPPFQELAYQQIVGITNLKQISWIQAGLKACRSVCRILTPGGGFGTGFLVGDGLLMTNNHVIGSAEVAAKSQAEFNYQQDESGGFLSSVRYELDPTGFHTNAALDFSLVRIRPDATKTPLSDWGILKLNATADPTPSEHVVIIQHPNGGYKQIVLTANWVMATQPPFLHYTTDTLPGSSGSPVFNDSWHVVAIHHAGGRLHKDKQGAVRYVNEGVLMSAIRAHLGTLWPQPQ